MKAILKITKLQLAEVNTFTVLFRDSLYVSDVADVHGRKIYKSLDLNLSPDKMRRILASIDIILPEVTAMTIESQHELISHRCGACRMQLRRGCAFRFHRDVLMRPRQVILRLLGSIMESSVVFK